MKTNLRYSNICLRALALLCLLMASVGAWAQTRDGYYKFSNRSNTAYYLSVSNNNYNNNAATPYLLSSNASNKTGDDAIWAVYSYNNSKILVHATDGRIVVTHNATSGAQRVHLETIAVTNNNNQILFTQSTTGGYYRYKPNASNTNVYLNAYGGTNQPNDIGLYQNDNGGNWSRTNATAPTIVAPTISSSNRGRTVDLACTNTYARIYYTTDGTNPTTSSTRYTGSFNITETKTIKARAYVGFIKADGTFEVVSQSIVTTQEVEVLTTPTTLTFANASPTITAGGWGIQLPAVTLKANETTLTGRTITYSATGCAVNNNGTVTGLQDAGATITASFAGDDTYAASSATYIITGTNHDALNETIIGSIAITPAAATLDLNGTQEYSIPASVTATTRTCEQYKEFACPTGAFYSYASNNNWQYTLTKPTVIENTGATVNLTRVNWTYSGGQGQYFQPTATNNKVTLTRTDQKTDHNQEFTITANATYGSADKTATATVVILKTVVDITQLNAGTAISLQYGETESLDGHFSWQPNYESAGETYKNFTYTSQDVNVAIVDANGNVTASGPGSTKVTVQSKKQDGTNGPSCEVTVNVTLDAPAISIDAAGKVTITHPSDGVTILYTSGANPNDPTATSGTVFGSNTSLTLTNEQYVKAIAVVNSNNKVSAVAQKQYITSGISGGKVILNDYEDHTWTYYAGVDSEVDGGNYNTNYAGKIYSPNPRNVKITYLGNGKLANLTTSVTGVKVGVDADANTFVYYKTIENNGGYKYTTIPNPFSVRPKINGNYYGFVSWRVKSVTGGSITGYAVGSTINAETEITFVPTSAYTINCTSMEVELEAVWDVAEVSTNGTFTKGYNSVERNFYVVSSSSTNNLPVVGTRCTYSSFYPNGTTNGTTAATMANRGTRRGNFTCTADSKVEYIILSYADGTINADAYNLTIGRGCSPASGVSANLLYGMTGKTVTNPQFHLRVESGVYDYMSYLGGYYSVPAASTGNSSTITGDQTHVIVTMGSDYDRAVANGNNNLQITYAMMMGTSANQTNTTNTAFRTRTNRDNPHTLDLTIKSGKLGTSLFMETATGNTTYLQGGAGYGHYFSMAAGQTNVGRRNILMEGGETCTLGSGIDVKNNSATGGDANNTTTNRGCLSYNLRIKGGIVHGNVYGGAAQSPSGGNRVMVVTGGQVKGWFAAGCNGTSNDGGQNYGTSWVYIGGNGRIDSEGSTKTLGYAGGGNVYAAGAGRSGSTTCGEMTFGSNLVIADNSYIERGAYGGGNYGYTLGSSNIYITGGTNAGNNDGVTGSKGGVYGGANQQDGPEIKIWMTGGKMLGGVYGGSNTSGTISGNVAMQVNGGQVGQDAEHTANIHGGGYGNGTVVSQNVDITLGKTGAARDADGVTVWGDVYGGSALGSVNGTAATNTYHTNVTMKAGYIHGSLYGGALGAAGTAANVYGPVQVKVYGGSVMNTDGTGANGSGAVYGANNINGAPQMSATVDIYGTNSAPAEGEYALFSVYGGGNQANYTYGNGYPKVTVHNCDNSIEYVYGGGNAAAVAATDVTIYGGDKIGNVFGGGNGQVQAANVTGGTNVKIYGGTIGDVYGGSNTNGTIGGTISVNVNAQAEGGNPACPIDIDNVYGGGNKAASAAGNVTIGCAEHIGAVYGGANQANINSNINLSIVSGHIDNVFGGNNTSGNISGTITVTVNDNNSACGMEVGNVYGGGNQAAYTAPATNGSKYPAVNIQNGHLTGSVFGGGLGETAVVTGNPQVTIGQPSAGTVHIDGNVFGGGDAANVVGKPVVLVQNCSTVIGTKDGEGNWNAVGGTVYGGGNAAHVTGAGNGTSVTINGGDINRVFGGGNGEVSPANVQGNAVTTIHAGNIHQAFAGSNMQGSIGGSASITIDHDGTCDELVDEVYGGGNEAAGSAGAVNIECGAIVGDVYGGANQADVNSDITLNITGGTIDRVFGGNNTSGNITGQITVNVDKGSCELSLGDVFGAGNLAQYAGGPIVNIKNGTVTRNVYGGGKGDPEDHTKGQVTGNPIVTIGDMSEPGSVATVGGDVYGGGDAGNVVGTPQVRVPAKTNTTIANVYGGGNAADVNGTDLLIDGGTITGMVFGGGHGSKDDPATPETEPTVAANVNGNVQLYVTGGTINKVFAGSNANGNITGDVDFQIAKGNTSNEMHINEVYGGGNEAAGNAGTILIGCTGSDSEGIGDVYGGANAADINSDITLTITGGRINNVFGGNNTSGDIKGDIEVNVEWNGGCTNSRIGNVYGGGNLAQYSGSPVVNIKNGTISQNVYGGGKGDPADHTKGQITGAPVVNIGDNTDAGWVAHVVGDVYGGGDAGNVVGTPQVNIINKCNTVIDHDVYGGGNAADVSSTDVNIDGGTITGMVFGGGHGDLTSEPQKEANVGGDVHVDITGGSIGKVFGGSNSKGSINGTINLNINKEDGHCDMHITEVYGGGNLAAGNAGTILIGCTGGDSEGIGDVYGGANAADIDNAINLTIKGGRINRVFGGNNASGSITGPITVNVDWDDELTCGKYLGEVFGGGNLANYANATEVNMKKGTVNHIYGGGNEAGVGSATVNMLGGDVLQGLYGGCNTSGTVTGDIAVNVTGGQVGTDAEHKANVHGGGYGSATGSNGNVDVAVSGGVLFGDVYGGSALGNVNGTSADASKHTNVSVSGGTINGDVYGGGLGSKSPLTEAKEYGTVNVTIDPGANITGDVFGCNNAAGAPQGAVNVVVNGTSALQIHNVYGGGNEAAYSGTPSLTVNGCLAVINDLYGGGNAAATGGTNAVVNGGTIARAFGGGNGESGTAADVNGNSSLTIHGGTISQVFGGSNSNGTVSGTMTLEIDHTSACEENITDVYGGGNMAPGKVAVLTIGCGAGPFVNVFGGSNNANVSGNIVLNITGGTITNVFGGNNTGGTIDGTVTVNVSGGHLTNVFGENNAGGNVNGKVTVNIEQNDLEDCEHLTLDYVYGGGKNAAYNPSTPGDYPEVNLIKGVVNHDVFGGGLGESATVASNPTVNMRPATKADFTVKGNIYGGGNAARVNGSTSLTISNGTIGTMGSTSPEGGYVFGGGLGQTAVVSGDTRVQVTGNTDVEKNVYGGGNGGEVQGDTKVIIGE